MLIQCGNKGCMQQTNALFDSNTLEVICQECGQSISNVSDAMKRTLKSFGQIIRDDYHKAFMMACRNCVANREIVLNEKNETICSVCKQVVNVHPSMKQAIIEIGQRVVAQTGAEPAKTKKKTTSKKKRKLSQ